jgi:hypothetical protein
VPRPIKRTPKPNLAIVHAAARATDQAGLADSLSPKIGPDHSPRIIEAADSDVGNAPSTEHYFETRISLVGLSQGGMNACADILQKLVIDLANEASRVMESSRQSDSDEPEITADTIRIAYSGVVRRQVLDVVYQKERQTWRDRGIAAVATLGMAGAGFMATYLHAKWQVGLFTTLVLLGSLSTLHVLWRK